MFTLQKPPEAQERFGESLTGTSDVIYVGDPSYDSPVPDAGAVFVFEGLTGAYQYTILNPDPAESDQFGAELAVLSDASLVVGVPQDDSDGADAGLTYVFTPGTSVPLHTLRDPSPTAGDRFGAAVDAGGGRVIVGAPADDTAAPNGGAAFLFDAANGSLLLTITGIVPTAESGFGSEVAAISEHVAISHPGREYTGIFGATDGVQTATLGGVVAVASVGSNFLGSGPFYECGRACSTYEAMVRVYGAQGGVLDYARATISADKYLGAHAPSVAGANGHPVVLSPGWRSVLNLERDSLPGIRFTDLPCNATLGSAEDKVLVGTPPDSKCAESDGDGSVLVYEAFPPAGAPATPTDLQVAPHPSAPNGWLELTWTDHSFNETRFEIVRQTGAKGAAELLTSDPHPSTGTVTLGDHPGFPPSADKDWVVSYRVRACNLTGCSGYSNSAVIVLGLARPDGLVASVSPSPLVVHLDWNDRSSHEEGYQVERRRFDEAEFVPIERLHANQSSYLDRTALPGTAYSYRVRAVGPNAASGYSNTAEISTLAPQAALIRTISSPNPHTGEGFGLSVARLGDRVIVGAPWSDLAAGYDSGRAYVFNARTGTLQFTLQSPVPQPGDRFGWSVSSVRCNILVGAPYADEAAPDSGVAYLFSGRTGQLLTALRSPNPAAGELFGLSVSPAGDNIIIGAPGNSSAFAGSGVAYITDPRNKRLRTLVNPTPAPQDFFGRSVAAIGDLVSIAAPGDDAGVPDSGSAYNLNWRANSLLSQGDLAFSVVPAPDRQFLVGVLNGTGGTAPRTGFAYLMNPESGLPERTFTNPAPSDEDQFGFSVAAGQMDILVGAPQGDPYFTDSGWVWVYDSASGAAVLRFDNPSPGIGDRFGAALSPLVDGMFAVGAPNDDAASIDTGSVSIFQGRP